jgi:adenosylhomocysteine nucleosidase
MHHSIRFVFAACILALAGCAAPPPAPDAATPRIAIISAFPAELTLLQSRVEQPRKTAINGVEFTTGTLQGKPVVMFLSGISMTNAAMNTQLVLDRFKVSHIVFSGVAGGVNPELNIGDVVVAQRWGQYLEVLAARETAPGRYKVPTDKEDSTSWPNFGMLFPRPVGVRSAAHDGVEKKFWFEADPALMEIARRASRVELTRCDTGNVCLRHEPRVVIGGNGVSGQAFVDNAAFREYTFKTFQANVLDMETAATAMVAYSNGVPFIAFRSLSDLAGGGEGENEIGTFFKIAADNSARVLLAFLAAWK